MAKEWILSSAMNRFQLNFKRNVGATSEAIRKCNPRTLNQWREYYFSNVRSREHIEELGKKLHTKITEVIYAEIENVTEYRKRRTRSSRKSSAERCFIYSPRRTTTRKRLLRKH
jgi:hypothetical protein